MTEEKFEALTYAITEFFDPKFLNRWVSVKERSVAGIFKKWNISAKYSTAFYQILKERGLAEINGVKIGLQYKLVTSLIPDAESLAKEVKFRFNELNKKIGYKESKPSDLQPKRSKSYEPNLSGNPTFVKREPLALGDLRFFMHDNHIYEGRIVSIFYKDDISHESLYCDVEVVTNSELNTVIHSVRQSKMYKSVDDLVNRLKAKVVKYKRASK